MQLYTDKDIAILDQKIDGLLKQITIKKHEIFIPTKEDQMRAIQIVLDYVKDNNRIIYGGYAQNKLIIQKNKEDTFYDEDVIPDIDFYSYDPIMDMKIISNKLFDAGFKYVQAMTAQHKETYKVTFEFTPVADISYVPKYMYHKLPYVEIGGLKYISVPFAMIDMYRILTDPFNSSFRWAKHFKRIVTMQKNYPFNKATKPVPIIDKIPATDKPNMDKLLGTIYKFLKNNDKAILFGRYVYNYYLEESGIMKDKKLGSKYKVLDVPYYEFVSTKYRDEGKKLIKLLKDKHTDLVKDISVIEHYPFWNLNGYSASIKYKDYVVAHIVHYNHRCIPIQKVDAKKYNNNESKKDSGYIQLGAYDYIFLKNLVYGFWMRVAKDKERINYHNIIISHLIEMRNYYLKENKKTMFDKTLFQEFLPTCTGEIMDPGRKNVLDIIKKGKYKYNPERKYEKEPEVTFKFANTSGNPIRNERNLRLVGKDVVDKDVAKLL